MAYSGLMTRPNGRFRDHDSYAHISKTLGLRGGQIWPPLKCQKMMFIDINDYIKQNN